MATAMATAVALAVARPVEILSNPANVLRDLRIHFVPDGRADGRTHGRSDGRTVGRTDGRTVGRADGRTVGRTDGQLHVTLRSLARLHVTSHYHFIQPVGLKV